MKTSNNLVIADSSALYSLIKIQDSNHKKALKIIQTLLKENRTVLIPGDVFSEMLNVTGKKLGKAQQLKVAGKLSSEGFILAEADEKIRISSVEKLRKLPGSVSYTDCVVMAFADEYKTKDILGFDEVFSKQGYKLP